MAPPSPRRPAPRLRARWRLVARRIANRCFLHADPLGLDDRKARHIIRQVSPGHEARISHPSLRSAFCVPRSLALARPGDGLRRRPFGHHGQDPRRERKGDRRATLLAYHLSSERLYTSDPSKSNGECKLRDVPYGYHDLAVQTDEGLFVATGVVNVPPNTTAVIVLTLHPAVSESAERGFPGSEEEAAGVAELLERLRGRAFWKSARGVAVLGGIGG